MQVRLTLDSTGRCPDSARVAAAAKSFGLDLATKEEIFQLRDAAAALFDSPIASAETFDAVNQASGASVFGYRPKGFLEGYLALIPLRPFGLELLRAGTFDGISVDLETVARPGEQPAALYVWGAAAINNRAAYTMVVAFRELRRAFYWAIPFYTRMASFEGMRLALDRMQCTPTVEDPSLGMCPPFQSIAEAAA